MALLTCSACNCSIITSATNKSCDMRSYVFFSNTLAIMGLFNWQDYRLLASSCQFLSHREFETHTWCWPTNIFLNLLLVLTIIFVKLLHIKVVLDLRLWGEWGKGKTLICTIVQSEQQPKPKSTKILRYFFLFWQPRQSVLILQKLSPASFFWVF